MINISAPALEAVNSIVDSLFDRMALSLLGRIPALQNKKVIVFSPYQHYNLSNLFIQALGERAPTKPEEEVMKNLLGTAHSYIEALKHKTKAKLAEELGSSQMTTEEASKKIAEILGGAGNHFKLIAETEATKARNTAKMCGITKVAADMGVSDPYVYFAIVRDAKTCHWCIKNHTTDGITPKVFKLSEVKLTYLTKQDRESGAVSCSGIHPHCRCSIVFLPPSHGFKNGRITHIGIDHDEYKAQRGYK